MHVNGWEFAVTRPLGPLTQDGVRALFPGFANATLIRPLGPSEVDFRGFSPKNINWGFMFNRRPISFVAKWYLIGKKRLAPTAAAVFRRAGWNYQKEKLRLDTSLDYQLTSATRSKSPRETSSTIGTRRKRMPRARPRYAKFAFEGEYGVTYQFGIKGTF